MTTSEQARADAMADAETLRRVCFGSGSLANDLAVQASSEGTRAGLVATGKVWCGTSAYDYARFAAHAAFRAVPGLRGDLRRVCPGLITGVFLAVLVLAGCGGGSTWTPTEASNPVEDALISDTAKWAGVKSVKVRGEITDEVLDAQKVEGLVGFYDRGVAWYYRPMVAKYVSIEDEPGHETAGNVSAHEVCHAVTGPQHDIPHWDCMASIARPTYPRPTIYDPHGYAGPAFARIPADAQLGGVR